MKLRTDSGPSFSGIRRTSIAPVDVRVLKEETATAMINMDRSPKAYTAQ